MLQMTPWKAQVQSWALEVFLDFFNDKKWFFAFFIKLIWLGVFFLNRTGAEIGNQLAQKWKKNYFLLLKKLKNTESAQFCPGYVDCWQSF